MFYLLLCVTCISGDGGDEDDDDDEWEDTDEEGDFDSDGGLSGDEDPDAREFLFMDEETKSRFTEYSLTSSVMRRNEQLTLLDDRFEKVNAPPRLARRPKSRRGNPPDRFLKAKTKILRLCDFSFTNSLTTTRSALWTTPSWKASSNPTALVWKKSSRTISSRRRRSERLFCRFSRIVLEKILRGD